MRVFRFLPFALAGILSATAFGADVVNPSHDGVCDTVEIYKKSNASDCVALLRSETGNAEWKLRLAIDAGYAALGSDSSESAFKFALELDSKNDKALFGMGRNAFLTQGELGDTAGRFNELIKQRPDSWLGYYGLAQEQLNRSVYVHALTTIEKGIALDPDNWMLHVVKGRILRGMKDVNGAYLSFEKSAILYKTNFQRLPGIMQETSPWVEWAGMADARNDFDKSVFIFEEMFRAEPETLSSQTHLVWFAEHLESAGKFAQAASQYDKAAALPGRYTPEEMHLTAQLARLKDTRPGSKPDLTYFSDGVGTQQTKKIIRLQVMLKNSGYHAVEINGVFDDITRNSLLECSTAVTCKTIGRIPL